MDQQSLTVTQFGASAAKYLTSTVHAAGADLDRLAALAADLRPARALDLGCGAGHVSFALARGGAPSVIAYDPSAEMVSVVTREAAARGHTAIEGRIGAAETLPFDSGSFELVVTRFSAHHWADVPRAMSECARVLSPGGRLIVIDVIAPETPLFDTSLQVIEFLRDASHVRDYRESEWRAMQRAAGFSAARAAERWRLPMEFSSWIARLGTPAERVAALRSVFAGLPTEARQYFEVGPNLSFSIDAAWMEARKPA